jgi:hypothetical protein
MSKHEKQVRRARRKTERQRSIRNGGAALAAAAAIAAGTSAYADPIRFDNPAGAGHFNWFDDAPSQLSLDISLPAASQTGVDHNYPSEFLHLYGTDGSSLMRPSTAAGAAQTTGFYDYFIAPFAASQLVPDAGFAWLATESANGYAYYPGYGSELPSSEPTYIGVRFDPGDGTHYGWIGVTLDSTSHFLDAFAWGYETEVGVPIAAGAPEPGSLALLAMGAVGAMSRRRRA